MAKYNLTSKIINKEELQNIKESFKKSGLKVDGVETFIRSLDLTEFELHILGKRLLNQ